MKTKKIYFFLYFVYLSLPALGQSDVGFAYDMSGNRVKREIIVHSSQGMKTRATSSTYSFIDNVGECSVHIKSDDGTGIIKVTFMNIKSEDDCNICVYTVSGIKLLSQSSCREENIIDISNQPRGVYVLQIMINNIPTTWKITKK